KPPIPLTLTIPTARPEALPSPRFAGGRRGEGNDAIDASACAQRADASRRKQPFELDERQRCELGITLRACSDAHCLANVAQRDVVLSVLEAQNEAAFVTLSSDERAACGLCSIACLG